MVSSVEMVLWAIHHATTLLFGVFASAALCGIEINRRHALELVLVGAVTGCAFGLANAVGGELFARQVYPLVVHLPLVYYVFDYATNVYTTLFHSGSVVTVEFLAFALCAFYLMFLAVYLREYEEKETAERERWMLETRDSAAIKELEAWRQSGRELSILRHDMRHFLRGLAALIEEGHTDEALDRIDELCEAGDRTAVRRFCANETVNIALSSFNSDINRNGITANLRAAVPETIHVGDADLFSVLSNALENAITAASAAPQGKRFVDFDLRLEDGQLLLLVSNTFDRAPRMVDGMPVTRHAGHGFGTRSIKLAVERMNGNCQFRINGDRFELRAVM